MALEINQTLQDIANRIFTNIQANLPELNPSVRQSVIRALSIAFAGRFYDLYVQFARLKEEIFPVTATELAFIDPYGAFKNLSQKAASAASGFMTSNATLVGVAIPESTNYTANGINYSTIGGEVLSEDLVINVAEISRNGSVVSIETEVDHQLATNIEVTISGVQQTEYNGTFTITVTETNRFTYIVEGAITDPAGNNILVTARVALINIQADALGLIGNVDAGGKLTIQTPLAGINNDSYVQFTTISGGAEQETVIEYKNRMLNIYRNPISFFSNQFIINEILKIAGNTRCWSFSATPEPGYVSVYFVRDNTVAILPTGQDVNNARAKLEETRPAPQRPEWLLVNSPLAKVIDFTFTKLVPNSIGMQKAIRTNLELFFKTQTNVAENVTQDGYRAAIYQSLNEETGEFVTEFELAEPHGDIEIGTGELALLGEVVF